MTQLTKTKPVLARRLASNCQIVTADSPALVGRWNKSLTISIDAEWANRLVTQTLSGREKDTYQAQFLSSQFSWYEHDKLIGLIIWHPDYPLPSTVDIVDGNG